MSEKRFSVDDDGIYDTQEKKHFKFIAYDWIDCDIYECCEKLNEQQATINEYKENWDDMVKLATKTSLRNIELDEQIGQLRKELNDCEKFRYTVFKRIGELNDE